MKPGPETCACKCGCTVWLTESLSVDGRLRVFYGQCQCKRKYSTKNPALDSRAKFGFEMPILIQWETD